MDTEDYDDYNEEGECEEIVTLNDGVYTFKIELCEHELKTVKEIRGVITRGEKLCGRLVGYYIERVWLNNFYESCDSVSEELQYISNVLFHKSGRLRRDIWENILKEEELLQKSSVGGYINIDYIEINDGFRGNQLGFKMLSLLFKEFKEWTIAVMQPGLTAHDRRVADPIKTLKEHYVCQLFARIGFRFIPIESCEPFWFLIPSQLVSKTKDDVKSIKWKHLSNDLWSPYQNKLSTINSTHCFEETLVVGYEEFRKRPNDMKKAIDRYAECLAIMPEDIRKVMVDYISPRMMDQLSCAAYTCYMFEMDSEYMKNLPNRKKIKDKDIPDSLLFQHFPKEVLQKGVYKSFISGSLKVLKSISNILSSKKSPTRSLVMDSLSSNWPPSYKDFLEHGGIFKHVFLAIVEIAKESSWSQGDGSHYDLLTDVPVVWLFDEDFHYIETYYLKYLQDH